MDIARVLEEHRQHIVVVGGSVPELLMPDAAEPYVGTIDVDLALDHRSMGKSRGHGLRRLLRQLGHGSPE